MVVASPPPSTPTANFLFRSFSAVKRKEDAPMFASLSTSDAKSTILYCLVATKSVITYIKFVPSFVSHCLYGCGLCSLNWLIWICALSANWTLDRLRNAAPKSPRVRCAFVRAVHSAADSRHTGKASCLWCVDVAWPSDRRPEWCHTARITHETSSWRVNSLWAELSGQLLISTHL